MARMDAASGAKGNHIEGTLPDQFNRVFVTVSIYRQRFRIDVRLRVVRRQFIRQFV